MTEKDKPQAPEEPKSPADELTPSELDSVAGGRFSAPRAATKDGGGGDKKSKEMAEKHLKEGD